MKLNQHETEAVEYLREWAREGFPRRADQSFPTDFFTAMRRIMDLPPQEDFSARRLEAAFAYAGPDADYVVPRRHHWSYVDMSETKAALA